MSDELRRFNTKLKSTKRKKEREEMKKVLAALMLIMSIVVFATPAMAGWRNEATLNVFYIKDGKACNLSGVGPQDALSKDEIKQVMTISTPFIEQGSKTKITMESPDTPITITLKDGYRFTDNKIKYQTKKWVTITNTTETPIYTDYNGGGLNSRKENGKDFAKKSEFGPAPLEWKKNSESDFDNPQICVFIEDGAAEVEPEVETVPLTVRFYSDGVDSDAIEDSINTITVDGENVNSKITSSTDKKYKAYTVIENIIEKGNKFELIIQTNNGFTLEKVGNTPGLVKDNTYTLNNKKYYSTMADRNVINLKVIKTAPAKEPGMQFRIQYDGEATDVAITDMIKEILYGPGISNREKVALNINEETKEAVSNILPIYGAEKFSHYRITCANGYKVVKGIAIQGEEQEEIHNLYGPLCSGCTKCGEGYTELLITVAEDPDFVPLSEVDLNITLNTDGDFNAYHALTKLLIDGRRAFFEYEGNTASKHFKYEEEHDINVVLEAGYIVKDMILNGNPFKAPVIGGNTANVHTLIWAPNKADRTEPATLEITIAKEVSEEEILQNAKDERIEEIKATTIDEAELVGKTDDSVEAAEKKLAELKEIAIAEVQDAETIEDVKGVGEINMEEVIALLEATPEKPVEPEDNPKPSSDNDSSGGCNAGLGGLLLLALAPAIIGKKNR